MRESEAKGKQSLSVLQMRAYPLSSGRIVEVEVITFLARKDIITVS